jgi:hypothetical protein
MNLHALLRKRLAAGRPVRVGLIGAGKFGSMFLSQIPTTKGLEVTAIADLSPDRAHAACRAVGWTEDDIAATRITDDAMALIASPDVEVVVEATGHAPAGIAHARRAIAEGKHIVMVNVAADVLAGPLLAREAERAVRRVGEEPAGRPLLVRDDGLFLAVGRVVIGRDGQKSHEIAVSVGGGSPGLGNAERIQGWASRWRRDTDDLLPFQSVIPIDLTPGHLAQFVQGLQCRVPLRLLQCQQIFL